MTSSEIDLPAGYDRLLESLKTRVHGAGPRRMDRQYVTDRARRIRRQFRGTMVIADAERSLPRVGTG
ncbi:hypothetical protein AB4Y87_10135 [Paenarthrobacter sp. RAF54_2]|uniref:hypothetical protein n=1 Tax=Paenarthrobacter sp. RAF54_2 TaxID=3233061 RepID=UPI003F98CE9F